MKYKFFFNYYGLLFSFLTDISGLGSAFYFKNRKNNFLKKIGKLTLQQKTDIKKFSEIYKKYYPDLPYIFYFKNKPQKELKKLLSEKHFKEINQIMINFNFVFKKIYEKEKPKLDDKKNKLKDLVKNKKYENVLLRLFNKKNNNSAYNVFLSLNNNHINDCTGLYWGDNNILLEISDCPIRNMKYVFGGVLLHEISHDLFEKSFIYSDFKKFCRNLKNNKLLSKISKKHKTAVTDLIEEMVVSSIVPEGFFFKKYFGKFPVRKNIIQFEKLRKKVGLLTAPKLEDYIRNNKAIDIGYFDIIVNAIIS